jgi:signal transduction histidine kinase/phage shock protein PspC (stress-responsive transcriptional regulator)
VTVPVPAALAAPAAPAAPPAPLAARPGVGAVRGPVGPRPPLVRPHTGRAMAGVAAGLAAHLGWSVKVVRIVLVVSNLGSGAGLMLYAWLWAFVPSVDGPVPPAPAVAPAAAPAPDRAAAPAGRAGSTHVGDLALGVLLLVAAASLIGARLGWAPRPAAVLPVLVMIGGAVVAYSQLDEVERSRWAVRTGVGTRGAVLRVVGGLVIVLTGVLLLVVQRTDLALAGRVLVATLAVLSGLALVLAPWGVRLWRDLDAERAARVRETERAEIAAHLHDSVLQTLALIQRNASDAAQVARLARAQERDLRDWLYGPRPTADATVARVVKEVAADVEDRHGVAVDLVVVGDGPVDDRVGALVAALREAMLNAVRHAGAPVSVYVEVGPDAVEAFVRDRGPGFDLSSVPSDRLGVRESIIGRMERHSGSARVRTDSDGTEVRLELPLAPAGRATSEDPDHHIDQARTGQAQEGSS